MRKALSAALLAASLCIGCASGYRQTIDDYASVAPSVRLGTSKAEVVAMLEPTQRRLHITDRKFPDMYMRGRTTVEILYFRSGGHRGHQSDDFTPYVFHDGRLVSVGWSGMQSAAHARPPRSRAASYSRTVLPLY